MLEVGSFQHPPLTQLVEEVFILFSVSYDFYHSSPPPHPPLHDHITEFETIPVHFIQNCYCHSLGPKVLCMVELT